MCIHVLHNYKKQTYLCKHGKSVASQEKCPKNALYDPIQLNMDKNPLHENTVLLLLVYVYNYNTYFPAISFIIVINTMYNL